MALRKTDKANLRKQYGLHIQIGLVFALALVVLAFTIDFVPDQEVDFVETEQEIVQMEEIKQTEQIKKPPPPPRPPVPVEVPNDEILEDEDLDLDATLDLDEPLTETPPPPPSDAGEEEEPEVFVIVEQMPELQGGLAALQENITYPEIARKAGVEGRVIVQFIVDEEGNVVDPQVVRGLGAGLDEEALRAVREATFTPGMQRGQPVRVKMSLPVTFKLR